MKPQLLLLFSLLLLAGCAQQPNREDECRQLRDQLTAQQRLQREQARRIDELQRLTTARLRQQRDEQERADDLQQKLDALRAIERELVRPGLRR